MNTTEKYKLKKPEPTDFYNIDDFNSNADAVDTLLFNRIEKVKSATTGNLVVLESDGSIKDSGKKTSDFLSSTTSPGSIGAATNEEVSDLSTTVSTHINNTEKHFSIAEKNKLSKAYTTDDIVVSSTQPAAVEGRIWIKV